MERGKWETGHLKEDLVTFQTGWFVPIWHFLTIKIWNFACKCCEGRNVLLISTPHVRDNVIECLGKLVGRLLLWIVVVIIRVSVHDHDCFCTWYEATHGRRRDITHLMATKKSVGMGASTGSLNLIQGCYLHSLTSFHWSFFHTQHQDEDQANHQHWSLGETVRSKL